MIQSMLTNYLSQKTFNFLNSMFTKPDEKNFIIDPFTCMVRLAVLSFKPVGTKISVNDNKISFCEPGFFQGPLRWSKGDNREDLHNIYLPIKKALLWYDTTDNQIANIFTMSISGLETLKYAYNNNSMICHSIDHYKTYINNQFKQPNNEEEDDNIIHKTLRKLWNPNEIQIINNILTEMKTYSPDSNEDLMALIKAIESILITKELKVKKIILETTTLLE
jgi:hypothetical protein